MGALDSAVRQGKALYVGISSYSAAKTREAAAILARARDAAADPPALVLAAQPLDRARSRRDARGARRRLHHVLAARPGRADRSLPGRHPGGLPREPQRLALARDAHRRDAREGQRRSTRSPPGADSRSRRWRSRGRCGTRGSRPRCSERAASRSSSRTSVRSTTSPSRPRSSRRSTATRPRAPSTSGRRRATADAGVRDAMEYRRLGSSDLDVSEIALGSWLTFGGGIDRDGRPPASSGRSRSGSTSSTRRTSTVAAQRRSSSVRCSARRPRDSYVLATKLYFPMGDDDRGLSRAQVLKQIDASLRRLRTDHVDLYQCHRYDGATPLEETMEALTEVVRAGQGPLPRVQRVDGGPDRGGSRPPRRRAVRLEPAAVLAALAAAGARRDPAPARLRGSRRSSGRRSARGC